MSEREAGFRVRRRVRRQRAKKLLLVVGAVVAVAALLASLSLAGVLSLTLQGAPVTEDYAWVVALAGAEGLRAQGSDGSGVTVCLVDTGIELLHPDLAAVDLAAWNDLVHREPRPYDDGGHGTAMAGLLAGQTRVRGVAPGIALIAVKALAANGTGSSETVGDAIDFCVDPNRDGDPRDGADIVSLSLGAQRTPFATNAAAGAAQRAAERGILVVAAAGNDGRADDGDVNSPADEPPVLAVGALDRRLAVASFSSQGAVGEPPRVDPHRKPEFVLPGVGLVTTASSASYTAVTGTSASAVLLAGLLALLLDALPSYRKAGLDGVLAVKAALAATAQPLEGQVTPHDLRSGYGIPQIDDAADRLQAA